MGVSDVFLKWVGLSDEFTFTNQEGPIDIGSKIFAKIIIPL